jgi:hypothetical protein
MKNNNDFINLQSNSKRPRVEVDLANLPIDPCLRKIFFDYHINDRDQDMYINVLLVQTFCWGIKENIGFIPRAH